MFKASPNEAHLALARFSLPQLRKILAPDASFTLITQSTDGLDRRAIERIYQENHVPSPFASPISTKQVQKHSGDPLLIDKHGHVEGGRCTSYHCTHHDTNFESPICPALAGTELLVEGEDNEKDAPSQPEIKGPKRSAAEARA
ncbi:hypothetical protein BN946_scf184569.g52 [Trametes cinnabarina]|uniref:Uncharacterized protein n=1 Tax=Pycnoporus cinnabarinus TaxID=5643 RepID=A0A060SE06_PYCCI|nr:hypothetical protein BN946_scf184569.g52 [Trametes cinnabarina]